MLLIQSFISFIVYDRIYAYPKHRKLKWQGVKRLTAKERILMIRLLEKAEKHPEFAKKLVTEAADTNLRIKETDPKGLTTV